MWPDSPWRPFFVTMAYITQSELEAKVEPTLILQALDDDKDGIQDVGLWEKVLAGVEKEIDGALGGTYSVPFPSPYPAVVVAATLVVTAEALYLRRGMANDLNPWAKQAGDIRKRLAEIGAGNEPLSPTISQAITSNGGRVIGEDARIYDENGRLMI